MAQSELKDDLSELKHKALSLLYFALTACEVDSPTLSQSYRDDNFSGLSKELERLLLESDFADFAKRAEIDRLIRRRIQSESDNRTREAWERAEEILREFTSQALYERATIRMGGLVYAFERDRVEERGAGYSTIDRIYESYSDDDCYRLHRALVNYLQDFPNSKRVVDHVCRLAKTSPEREREVWGAALEITRAVLPNHCNKRESEIEQELQESE